MVSMVDDAVSQAILFSAPNDTFANADLSLPYASIGAGVMPQRYIFLMPAASLVRNIEPTL